MRRLLLALAAALPPTAFALELAHAPRALVFGMGVLALLPIAYVIGRATEEAGKHVGPVFGGLLNATFGNAPELFLAFFALGSGLFEVVRASLTGSVPSNLLLVLGLTFLLAGGGRIERRSLWMSLGVVAAAALLFLVPAIAHRVDDGTGTLPAWEVPVCIALLVVYVVTTV